ncbi:MAG: hypothetical protein H0W36_13515, partial [Gemmatimonadetes bacterium]|nr:hypothetical protein [Gemmatimonadota bacterium]
MQDREAWTGIDTRMPLMAPQEAPQAQLVAVMPPAVQPPEDDEAKAARARIADLEEQIQALRNAQGEDLDLRAILDDQRAMLEEQFRSEREAAEERYQRQLAEMARNMAGGVGTVGIGDEGREARRRLEEERARQAAIAEAQIMSDGIVLDASGAARGSGPQRGETGGRGTSERRLSSNEAFIRDASTQSSETVRATRIAAPGRTIVQGTTVAAVLETAISTELPGVIRAVMSDDVLSYDGTNVLLPRGTRLIGSYNSAGSVVQGRVQIGWNRAVTPEGVSVELGGYGSDALGGSGQAG